MLLSSGSIERLGLLLRRSRTAYAFSEARQRRAAQVHATSRSLDESGSSDRSRQSGHLIGWQHMTSEG